MQKGNSQPTAMRALSLTEVDGHNAGIDLADEATLAEAGKQGVTAERLDEVWQTSYTLGRNAIEGALGSHTPYGEDQISGDQ